MNIRFLLLTVFYIALPLSELHSQDTLKFLSYNLEGMKPNTDYQARLQAIIQELKSLDPDVMGLQEVAQHSSTDNMAQIIADSLTLHFGTDYYVYWQFTHTAYSSYSEGLAIVSKWPVTSNGFHSLPVAVFPRKVLWNQIDVSGMPLHFFTAHLAYRDEDNATRIQQVNSIKSYIDSKLLTTPGPVLLTGDFNSTPSSDPIAQLSDYFSTWNVLHPTLPGFTYPSENPTKKIDYVFVKNASSVQVLQTSLKFDTRYNGVNYPSDHWGIMTHIALQPVALDPPDIRPDQVRLLSQPNPFNPNTVISYSLPEEIDVRLTIHDITGRTVTTLEETRHPAGTYAIQWQGENNSGASVSTGVYFCRLQAGEYSKTLKMLYLK